MVKKMTCMAVTVQTQKNNFVNACLDSVLCVHFVVILVCFCNTLVFLLLDRFLLSVCANHILCYAVKRR